MRKRISDWLDARTGLGALLHEALDEPIPGGARWRYVFGSALTSTFMIQAVTGLLLMFSYSPSSTTAWGSVYYISYEMWGGWFLRGLHHFGSQAMVVLLGLHLIQVLIAGAYRAPREVNWWFGMALLFVTLGFSLTGYLLPWDQKGYWATKVATNIASGAPVVGPYLLQVIVGGSEYGNQTITRFYGLHVGVFPALLVMCLAAHVALFRKHGVTAPRNAQGVDTFWPKQIFFDVVASCAVLGVLVLLVVSEGGANLDAPADPAVADYPARPEWYFLSLFQMLKFFEGPLVVVGTIVIPTAIVALLLLMPLFDKVIPGKLAHFLACTIVFALVGGVGYLTYLAITEDANNKKFQSDRAMANEARQRAIFLAGHPDYRIPPDGAAYVLRRDPLFHGGEVLENKCLSCHYYGGKGQVTTIQMNVEPGTVEGVEIPETTAAVARDVPEVVLKALAIEAPNFTPTAAKRVENPGEIDSYEFQGSNAIGERVVAEVDANGKWVETRTFSKQTASDLKGFGSRAWIRGLLEKPDAPDYFGKLPQLNGMKTWKKGSKLSPKELDTVADFVATFAQIQPEENLIQWYERTDPESHPGYKLFTKECAECHGLGEPGLPLIEPGGVMEAPNLFAYGSTRWLTRMIENPGADSLYGYLEEEDRMPAFADRLSENDMTTLVRYLQGDYLVPGSEPTESRTPSPSKVADASK